ncbi:MAG TPA: hypothetical protein VEB18_02805 [Candidatus Paceibacterota bacterium]|nr:hypothetical protein [Candidatus Paceibacterota bacterium]
MDLANPSRVYRLSFRSAKDTQGPPTLVFRLSTYDGERLGEQLRLLEPVLPKVAQEYTGTATSFFWPGMGHPELFAEPEPFQVGYGRCGRLVTVDDEVEVQLPLSAKHLFDTALTITILLESLNALPKGGRPSNRQQLLRISTLCQRGGHYAHAAHGHVFPVVCRWLAEHPGKLPSTVTQAMKEVWRAVAPKELRRYENECVASVTDGRFFFGCFGNACDLAIYPDNVFDDEFWENCSFSCHNLDTAFQQLTLLSGLAAMTDLIRDE